MDKFKIGKAVYQGCVLSPCLFNFYAEYVMRNAGLDEAQTGIKTLAPWKKSYDQPRQHIKKQRHYFANKGPSSQSYGFSSSHVWMGELGHKESRALKN